MKTQTVTVTFEMPIGHLDADSILEKMQDTVEDILINYGKELDRKEIMGLLDGVTVEIDANPVPTPFTL
jgi:hypothetical protein